MYELAGCSSCFILLTCSGDETGPSECGVPPHGKAWHGGCHISLCAWTLKQTPWWWSSCGPPWYRKDIEIDHAGIAICLSFLFHFANIKTGIYGATSDSFYFLIRFRVCLVPHFIQKKFDFWSIILQNGTKHHVKFLTKKVSILHFGFWP
jgi:hypothetical protein